MSTENTTPSTANVAKDPKNPNAKHGNRYDTGPSLSVAVGDCRGGWNGGHFAGDKALKEHAELAASVNAEVVVYGATLTAGNDTPLGAYAALASYSPGRIIAYGDVPDEIVEHMSKHAGDDVIIGDAPDENEGEPGKVVAGDD